MPTYDDYVRDYWAPDREEVLSNMRAGNQRTDTGWGPAPPVNTSGSVWDPGAPIPPNGTYGTPVPYGNTQFNPDGTVVGSGQQGSGQRNPQNTAEDQAIINAYGTYLGRDPDISEIAQWRGNPNFARDISRSPEAQYAVANSRGALGPAWQYASQNPANQPGGAAGGTGGGATGGGATGGGGYNAQQLRQALLAYNVPASASALKAFITAHPEFASGVTIGGSKSNKLYGPNGEFLADVIQGTSGSNPTWAWDDSTGSGSSSGSASGSYSGQFGQAPTPTPFAYDPFNAPEPFSYEGFTAPTGLTEANDPGYQARLALGQQGLERSAASRGTLLTGGTLKDLNQYAQDYASNEFGNVYNRALQDYGVNRTNAFQNYTTNYQNAIDAYRTNFDAKFKPWDANYNQAYQSWLGNFNAANQGFQNNLASEQQRYNQLYGAAQLGLMATGQYSNALGSYGNTMSNIYSNAGAQAGNNITGAGNANAAGIIGAGNAWGNLYAGLGNTLSAGALWGSVYGNRGTNAGSPPPYSGPGVSPDPYVPYDSASYDPYGYMAEWG